MKRLLLALALALPLFGQTSGTTTGDLPAASFSDCFDERGEYDCFVPAELEERSYFDGCNWCNCTGEICNCTLMACSDPAVTYMLGGKGEMLGDLSKQPPIQFVYDGRAEMELGPGAKITNIDTKHRGILRKLARWLW